MQLGYGESSKLAAALDGLQGIEVIAEEARVSPFYLFHINEFQ